MRNKLPPGLSKCWMHRVERHVGSAESAKPSEIALENYGGWCKPCHTVLSIHGAGDFNLLANTPNNLQILTEHQVFKRYVNERVTDGPRPLSVGLESRNWIIVVIFCQNLYKASSKRSLSSRAKQKDEQRRTEFQHTMTELSRNVYRKSYKAYFVWSNEL